MANKYEFECIELLRNELLFAPTRIRRRNIFRLERLISAIKPDRKYPYDYVHHKITNYRPDGHFMVLMPGSQLLKDLLRLLAVEIGPASSPPDGVTLDPGGYASPLLGAFEGGSGGDLRKPVLKQRLTVKARATAEVIRFMDGEAAIVSQAAGKGRALVLAFGPGRAWGDLATRPEFVVLMHSLVESVAARDGPDEANVTVGRGPGWRRPDNRRPPGNYPSRPAETAVAGRQGPFSVNLCPDETADLAPRPDRLTQAFAPQRVRIASPADLAPASLAKTPSADAEGWFILPFALAVALEGLVAGRLSRPVSATPEPLARA